MQQYQIDIIRGVHLLALALGLGTSIYLDLRILSRFRRPVSTGLLAEFHRIHRLVFVALGLLWLSGLALIGVRTGFDLATFSPKLWLKLGVVTLLSLNALLIGLVVMPTLERLEGAPLGALPRFKRCLLAPIAAVSIFSWLAALALGSSKQLKMSNWDMLIHLFLPAFAAIVLITELVALLAPAPAAGAPRRDRH